VAEGSESSSDSEGDAEEKAENERYAIGIVLLLLATV
jgi:hypothetical protein